ncbi:hypothetical protein RSAG8_12954, partial [Rhizoctonia solani AG-8 WAC10335]
MAESARSVPASTAPSGTSSGALGRDSSTAAGVAPINLSMHIRQHDAATRFRPYDAAVTKEFNSLKSRLRTAEDEISALWLTIVELQNRDEDSKKEREDYAFRIRTAEAHGQHLQNNRDEDSKKEREDYAFRIRTAEAHGQHLQNVLYTYLKSQGVQIDNLGGATTMSELIVGKSDALSTEDNIKATEIMNESLANLYGVKKFSPKEHGPYPKVSKSHLEWPSRIESGVRVSLHRFKWDEAYNSPLNQPTFSAWVDHSIQQGPALAGHVDLPSSILNQRVMSSLCAKRYSAIKQQVMRYHGDKKPKIAGIKRRGEELDAPESKIDLDSGVEPSADVAHDYQLHDHPGHDSAPLIDPALLGSLVQVSGVADLQMPEPVPGSPIPGSSGVHKAYEDVKPDLPAESFNTNNNIRNLRPEAYEDVKPDLPAESFNTNNNIRSRKITKLTTRRKQRSALSGADDKFKESKYDGYEAICAMSEDERIDSVDAKGETVTTFVSHAYDFLSQDAICAMSEDERIDSVDTKGETVTTFVLHAYDFLSQDIIDCRDAIDRVPDPTKNSKRIPWLLPSCASSSLGIGDNG